MERTQVYLYPEQKTELKQLSKITGKNNSEIIREALSGYLKKKKKKTKSEILNTVCGMWKNRTDLADFEDLRKSWDRDFSNLEH